MRNMRLKAAGFSLMLATTCLTSVNIYQAQMQPVYAQSIQSEADARKAVDKFFSLLMGMSKTPSYGKIEVLDAGKKIVVSDVELKMSNATAIYKVVEIHNYSEDAQSGNYSADQVIVKNLTIEMDKAYLEKLQQEQKKDGATAVENMNSFVEPMVMAKLQYDGIKGSYKDYSLSLTSGEMSGLSFGQKAPELSNVVVHFQDMKISQMDKYAKIQEKYFGAQEAIAKFTPELAEDMAVLMENFSLKKMTAKGFPSFPGKQGETVQLGDISMENVENGVIGDMSLSGFSISAVEGGETVSGKADKLSLKGMNLAKLYRLVPQFEQAAVTGVQPDVMVVAQIFQTLGGFSAKGIEMGYPGWKFSGNFDMNWGRFVGLFPTQFALKTDSIYQLPADVKADAAAQEADPLAVLKQFGIDKLDVKYELGLEWDEQTQKLTMSPHIYDIEQLMAVKMDLALGNLPKELLLEQDPQKAMVLAMGANVGPITIELTDKGAQKIYEAQAKGSWEAMSAGFAADPALKPLIDNVTKLVNSPNGKLKVVLKPKTELTFVQLSAAMAVDPTTMVSLFDIETSYSQ